MEPIGPPCLVQVLRALGLLIIVIALVVGAAFFGAINAEVPVVRAQGDAASTPAPSGTPISPPDALGGATEFARVDPPRDVTVMLDWTPNTNHLGLYVAQARGYFAEAGLNVTLQPAGDVQVEQVVALRRAEFGISYQETMTYARADGLPVVSIAAIIQHNTSGFAALADQHTLESPADLVGLRYGGFGSAIEGPIIDALISCEGDQPQGVEVIDIGFTEPFPLMERDRIDFVWLFYAWDGLRAELRGLDLDVLMLQDYPDCVPDYYTPLLITSEMMIDEQPDVVAAFVQGAARGYAEAIRDPSRAAELFIAQVPDTDAELVRASAAWLADQFQADAPRWGEQTPEIWERFTAFMVDSGALAAPIDAEAAFTNGFLPGEP